MKGFSGERQPGPTLARSVHTFESLAAVLMIIQPYLNVLPAVKYL